MKQYLIYLIVFSNIYNLMSQSSFGKVEYKYRIDDSYIDKKIIIKEKDENLRNTLNFLNTSLKNYQNKFVFTLKFNKTKSIYSMNKILKIESDREMKYAIIINRGKQVFFQDIVSRQMIYKTTLLGEEFNIKTHLDSLNWKLTRVQKKIGKYNCFKAVAFLNKKTKFEAWYTPEIPFSFGPKGIGGLPGLIIELKENNIIYYAQKILLNLKKDFKIELPKDENSISREKFDSIGKRAKIKLKKMANN